MPTKAHIRDTQMPALGEDSVSHLHDATYESLNVLVAVANDDLERAVLTFVRTLELKRHAVPTVLSAFDPDAYAAAPFFPNLLALANAALGPVFQEQRKSRIRQHVDDFLGVATGWPIETTLGDVVSSIQGATARLQSELVVLGLHRHGLLDRLFDADTARTAIRHVPVPVIAVRPELTGLPKHVVVAVDFSPASLRAARMARQLVDDQGTLSLVYVRLPHPPAQWEGDEGRALIEREGITTAFKQLTEELSSNGVNVTWIMREGDPVRELKKVAQDLAPDLIAIGSQRHPLMVRWLLGSVTSAIVHDGRWSVLVTPPSVIDDGEGVTLPSRA